MQVEHACIAAEGSELDSSDPPQQVPGAGRTSGQAGMTESDDARPVWRTVGVTSARDRVEHLVREEAMKPGSAGCYVAVCGRSVQAAALACPPGPRCPACLVVREAHARDQRHRPRQRPRGRWAWLNPARRGQHRAARTTDGAGDAH